LLPPPERQAMMRTLLLATDLALAGMVAEAIRMIAGSPAVRADAFGNNRLGSLLIEAGDAAGALRAFDASIALAPDYGDAHCNRGVALQRLRRLPEALDAYDAAARYEPGNVTAHFNRGNVLAMLGRFDEAGRAFDRALVLDPTLAGAHLNRGFVALARHRPEAALADFEKGLALEPDNAEMAKARLAVLKQLGRAAIPLAPLRRAQVAPGLAGALARARILIELNRCAEALALLPSNPPRGAIGARVMAGRSAALWRMERRDEALAAGRAAVDLAGPGDAEVHEELAFLCLKVGDFARGWDEHEYRLAKSYGRMREAEQTSPVWRGEDLRGKRVRVLSEQGFGDTLQFARYLLPLHALGATVIAVVQPGLRKLMGSMAAPIVWAESAAASADDDFHVHLMSLPQRFATRLETIPRDVPYLFADAERAREWAGRIGTDGFRIGVAWQGNPNQSVDHLRSVALAHFAPLAAVPRVRLISVQALRGLEQLGALPPGMAVEDLGSLVGANPEGFSEIAAVMANLDLVATSDTAVAHLAGALGRPVWLALHHDPDWRWLRERRDSPWYPAMRLFRQRNPGDWVPVFAEMAKALAGLADGRPKPA
jgi:tetratricopeptide (TPR) repeat protein